MNKMLRDTIFLLLACCCIQTVKAEPVYANKFNPINLISSSSRPFVTITAGPDFSHVDSAQTLVLLPPFTNHYTSQNSWETSGDLGIAAGLELKTQSKVVAYQLGIAGYFNSEIENQGHVWQFGLPEFDNFTYHYRVKPARIMATSKLLGSFKERFHPYLSAELGAAFNRASAYEEVPLIEEAVPMAPFTTHTKSSFAWGAGAGLDMDIDNHLRLGAGYQFADLGKASFGRSAAQLTSQTINLNHLYSHQLRFQLTALF